MFLPKAVALTVEALWEKGYSNQEIMKEAFTGHSPHQTILQEYLQDFEQFDNFMKCLLEGFEVDETEAFRKVGLLDSPYYLKDWTQYQATFMLFYYQHEDFCGSLWVPYPSKPNYEVNYSFHYDHERRGLGNSRWGEIEQAPLWFQELYHMCDTYVKARNQETYLQLEGEFESLYAKAQQQGVFQQKDREEQELYREITSFGRVLTPILLKKLQAEPHEDIITLLWDTTFFSYIIEISKDNLWEYNVEEGKAAFDLYQLRKYPKRLESTSFEDLTALWIRWGKESKWI